MKIAIAFLAGVVLASGTVYFVFNSRHEQPAAVQVAPAQSKPEVEKPSPAEPIVVENPEPAPEPERRTAPVIPARTPVLVRAKHVVPVERPMPVQIAKVIPAQEPIPAEKPAVVPQVPPPAQPAQPEPAPQPPVVVREPAPPPPPPVERTPNTVTLTANTTLIVRLAETIASDKQKAGEEFDATLDQPLVVDGLVVAERGSRVEGRIVAAESGGRVRGAAHLELELTKLNTSDGQRLTIRTNTFQRDGEKSIRDDVAKAGIGAALGAAIGAMAGGGKGAAIGAGAGGAAGTGVAIATHNKPAVVPVETRITFRLSLPITITERLQ